ncbi:Aste57867_18125 [Aphanomyces stellatus]|uniref:Aste57867_18125 protein n=1 Tax=Aphanomyces stellatus TaxID=120398 RepID=A0A485LCY4_9STRA|nr:hypothetical protein As57867_018063 [Aphanomyces stellatus]VFT94863.1 Aste57867_18125 [Aphanomyces stellatus]
MPRFRVLNDSPSFEPSKTSRRACGSPVSSEDEFDFEPRKRAKHNAKQGGQKRKPAASTKTKPNDTVKPKGKRFTLVSSASRKPDTTSPKFVWYLLHCLKESVQSKLSFEYGFGTGSIVPLPISSEWTNEQSQQFAAWLEDLGFTTRPTVNASVYRISNKEALAIVAKFSSQLTANPSATNTQALLAQMKAPVEDDNLCIMAAPATESPDKERDAFANYTQREPARVVKRQAPPPLSSLMWGSPIQADEHPRPRLSLDFNPPRTGGARRLSITSIPEEDEEHVVADDSLILDDDADHDMSASAIIAPSPRVHDRSDESLDLDEIEPSVVPSVVKRLSFSGLLTPNKHVMKKQPTRLSIDSIAEEHSLDLLNLSRDNIVVQSKKARNHMRRLSRLDVIKRADRRKSIFVPKLSLVPQDDKVSMPAAVATLVLTSQLLAMTPALSLVSKHWRKVTNEIRAWQQADYNTQSIQTNPSDLYKALPWGHYLSDGAYKQVFKVYSMAEKRYEAVSVMDVRRIESTGNENIVRQEIAHSLLFSNLVEAGTCPNFLRIHEVFLMSTPPDAGVWGSQDHPIPQGATFGATPLKKDVLDSASKAVGHADGLYQYIRMELCDGGNVEDYLRLEECGDWQSIFFQMAYALYAGREQHQLRHYDIKLLNFFMQSTAHPLVYGFEETVFELQLPFCVKLADYGTADTDSATLHQPIGLEHFTTLENAPMDFFLLGDAAEQGYAVDAFSLGLALLHLLTGSAPYEEILDDVSCPPALQKSLVALWKNKRTKKDTSFSLLQLLLADKANVSVLCDTVYRYCVLFGLGQLDVDTSPVAAVILQQLTLGSKRHATAAQMQYELDASIYSLETGSNDAMHLARLRLDAVPGAAAVLAGLVHFDPAQRPTLRAVLQSSLFASLVVSTASPGSLGVYTYARPHGEVLMDI